jgi:hypothetical protein
MQVTMAWAHNQTVVTDNVLIAPVTTLSFSIACCGRDKQMTKSNVRLLFEALQGSLSGQVRPVAYSERGGYVAVTINGNVQHISVKG